MKFDSMMIRIFFTLLSITSAGAVVAGDDGSLQLNDDVLGLIVFKSGIHDRSLDLAGWTEDDNTPCGWKFVQCNTANGRVYRLSLDGLGLSGKIGRGLEKLQYLEVLSLSGNNLSGGIPPQLGLLPHLKMLNLSKNSLSGSIPLSLSTKTTSMRFLDLSRNRLSGPVYDNMLENWNSLRFLSLAENHLEGPVPSTLSKCTLLNHLNLSNNHFSGELNMRFSGAVWGGLERLRSLDLSNNEFFGQLPPLPHNLKELFLQGNKLSGEIPIDLLLGFYCPHLIRLDLSGNLFTGTLPSLKRLNNSLSYLSLSNNLLDGDFPEWIGKMSSLEYLDLSRNGLRGSIPDSIGGLKMLKHLSLNDNKLTGEIPNSLVSCTALTVLRLRGNKLTGSIPEGLFGVGLVLLDLSGNSLNGSIPPGSGKLIESLQVMDLSVNNLTGDIPPEMGLLSSLRYLNLSWNDFHSRLIPEVGYSQSLIVLDLRNSALTGSIPGDVCESGSLKILQLDGNSLTGSIPDEIGNCSSLYLLSLSHNNISGTIPRSLSMLSKLMILKLEVNQLSGEIPMQLGKLKNLLAVNVSHNRLIGQLPSGSIFQNLDSSAIEDNLGICSSLLKGPCKTHAEKPLVINPFEYANQTDNDDVYYDGQGHGDKPLGSPGQHKFLSVSAILAISAAAIIAVGVMVVTVANATVKRRISLAENGMESMCSDSSRSHHSMATGQLILFGSKSSPDQIDNNSFESVLRSSIEVGEGVFGTVYKAPLEGEGKKVIAIKKLTASKFVLQHPEEFDREVRALGNARHPNLIPLRGYYWTPHLQLLVSDFVTGGNLESKLRPEMAGRLMTWPVRFKIMEGTAKGLAHLHHSCQPPIVHYNVKPSNILLDENLNPRISDFGLARLVTKLDVHVMSNRLHDTIGYVAPELTRQNLKVSEKCDVYGFGMLVLELVTGRRPVEYYGEDTVVVLNDHVRVLLEQGNVLDCVDPSMGGSYPVEEVLPVLKLALVCTSHIPSSRPSMADVVQILQVIITPIPAQS
ncbi:unnamed protein product [Cuscuta europaea]|uniref:Protein kinase domain-containing protein n=1 Tax=Cuscuta europaea TaxID=41803 RepID=A0A9P0ZN78_CUSEU|nr:unnamed protein product [Cuscuta europaea]